MAHVEGEIIINRPVEEVFDFVADARNEPRYNRAMVRTELITEEPIGAGSRFHAVMTGQGRSADMTIEFTTYERPRRLGSSTHLSTMEIDGMLTFEPVPAGTRMRWFWDLHPHGAPKFLTPLVTYIGERQEKGLWTGLKRYLESREVPVPSPG